MISLKHIPSAKLFTSEPDPAWFGNPANTPQNPSWDNRSSNWLKSRFHFSFAEYSNRHNSNFGVLRVMNDGFVQPSRGFGTHGHADMEIVTYIVEGSLTHKDSMGTEESLGPGSVQFMTAGRGIRHSEYNLDNQHGLRFIQSWIVPRKRGLKPNYGSFDPNEDDSCVVRNEWKHLVSDVENKSVTTPVEIEQDANLYVAELDEGQSLSFTLMKNRMAYVLCVDGSVKVASGSNDVGLGRHDGCELVPSTGSDGGEIMFVTGDAITAHLLMYEMEYTGGVAGRTDL
jgi:redox-sensitive bicupin YhaK (pirin superfamily)